MDLKAYTIDRLDRVKKNAPLIHNITNFVVMNSSANILLALGASPVMAHCPQEIKEMTALAGALVLNIGTLDDAWVESMLLAAETANRHHLPVILDPVGAGATTLRSDTVKRILNHATVSVLRGNASEIFALADAEVRTKGVDSSLALSPEVAEAARTLALQTGCLLSISGEKDLITDGERTFRVSNGQPIMTRVTGLGCGLSAVTAAFCAVEEDDRLLACAAATAFYGLCGDLAARTSSGPGSFFTAFVDALYTTGPREIEAGLRVEQTS